MPLISGFLRRLVGVNHQGQAEAQLGQLCVVCLEQTLGHRLGVEGERTAWRLLCRGIMPQNRHLLCPGEKGCEHCWRDSGRQRFPFACSISLAQLSIETLASSPLIFYYAYLKCLLLEREKREKFLPTT